MATNFASATAMFGRQNLAKVGVPRGRMLTVGNARGVRSSALSFPSNCASCKLALNPAARHHVARRSLAFSGAKGRRWCVTQLSAQSQEISWHSASVQSKKKVGQDRYKLVLDVGQDVAKGYTVAGQYVQLRCDESQKPAFIAIANTPSEVGQSALVEMVIKTNDGTAGAICELSEGAKLDCSPVMGKGFRVEERAPAATCPTVFLLATGTGIAPIRALINSGELDIANRDSVALYYGYRNEEYCAYGDEIDAWEKMGIKVVPVLSDPAGSWSGASGYVQDAFKAGESLDKPQGVVAVIAGQYDIAGIVTESFKEAKVPDDRVLLNF
mmetsp:Transcript_6362/g.16417  ORF Transcript_6362/g.16417 Transcript_6362/m.16417 type:complete len:327 (+) Transcript_6362:1-981(+)